MIWQYHDPDNKWPKTIFWRWERILKAAEYLGTPVVHRTWEKGAMWDVTA